MTPEKACGQFRDLVRSRVTRLNLPAFMIEDAIAYGYLGLVKAAQTHNPKLSKFISWATNRIDWAIRDGLALMKESPTVEYLWEFATLDYIDDSVDVARCLERLDPDDAQILRERFLMDRKLVELTTGTSKSWNSRRVQAALTRARAIL